MIEKARNLCGYGNMSGQQLENKFSMLSVSIPAHDLRPRPTTPRLAIKFLNNPTQRSRSKRISEFLAIHMDEFETMEKAITRPIP